MTAIGRVRHVTGVASTAGVVVLAAVVLAACRDGSSHASRSAPATPTQFVGRFPAGVASLSWHRDHATVTGAVDVAETTPSSPLNLVRDHTAVTGTIHGTDVSLDPGRGAEPWTGTLDGTTLTLTWTPAAGGLVTTIFTPGTDASFTADVRSYEHDVAAAQQATDASVSQQARKQAAADAAALARRQAHDAQVAALRAAHAEKVAAQRQRYDAAAVHAAAMRAAAAEAAAHRR